MTPYLFAPIQVVGGERGIEPSCGARVDADGFDPHADEGFSSAIQRTHSASKPGEWGLPSVALRNAV